MQHLKLISFAVLVGGCFFHVPIRAFRTEGPKSETVQSVVFIGPHNGRTKRDVSLVESAAGLDDTQLSTRTGLFERAFSVGARLAGSAANTVAKGVEVGSNLLGGGAGSTSTEPVDPEELEGGGAKLPESGAGMVARGAGSAAELIGGELSNETELVGSKVSVETTPQKSLLLSDGVHWLTSGAQKFTQRLFGRAEKVGSGVSAIIKGIGSGVSAGVEMLGNKQMGVELVGNGLQAGAGLVANGLQAGAGLVANGLQAGAGFVADGLNNLDTVTLNVLESLPSVPFDPLRLTIALLFPDVSQIMIDVLVTIFLNFVWDEIVAANGPAVELLEKLPIYMPALKEAVDSIRTFLYFAQTFQRPHNKSLQFDPSTLMRDIVEANFKTMDPLLKQKLVDLAPSIYQAATGDRNAVWKIFLALAEPDTVVGTLREMGYKSQVDLILKVFRQVCENAYLRSAAEAVTREGEEEEGL